MTTTSDSTNEPVVRVSRLTMRFARRVIHEDLDLTVRRGEVLGIAGGSGSGKTTLLREMAMLQQPTSGTIELLGNELSSLGPAGKQGLRRHIGVLFQNGALFGGMTVLENVAVPLHEHTSLSRQLIDEIALAKLALVGLSGQDGLLYPSQLSGGMRKRAALARAIALDPELLFLDEPTAGLDPLSADAFDELILDLKTALDPTVILVSHDMDTLWRVTDRVILIGEGRILAQGSMQQMAASHEEAVARFFQGPRGRAAQQSV